MKSEAEIEYELYKKKFKDFLKRRQLFFIFLFAFIFTGGGIYLAYKFIHNYLFYKASNPFFNSNSSIEDLGTVLSGTVGVVFTFVGIVLLAFTLWQTQIELTETQSILKNQLVESTFFNLLKNHKEVVLTPDRRNQFDDIIRSVRGKLLDFQSYERSASFPNFSSTLYNPFSIYKNTSDLKMVGQSLIHIANLIETKISDKEFYHRTFCYNLSESELFLIGFIIDNELEPALQPYCFFYNNEYNNLHFRKTGKNIPGLRLYNRPIKLYFKDLEKNELNENFLEHGTVFNIVGIMNDFTLKYVEYDYHYFDTTTNPPTPKNSSDRFYTTNKRLNFTDLFNQTLWNVFKVSYRVVLDFTFVFTKGEQQFCVQYKDYLIESNLMDKTGRIDPESIEIAHFCNIHNTEKVYVVKLPSFN